MQSLWNIKVAVLVKPEHENRISHVSTSSVKTGIANTLGEQGRWAPEGDMPVHASGLVSRFLPLCMVLVFSSMGYFELCMFSS